VAISSRGGSGSIIYPESWKSRVGGFENAEKYKPSPVSFQNDASLLTYDFMDDLINVPHCPKSILCQVYIQQWS